MRSILITLLTVVVSVHVTHKTGLAEENDYIVEEGIIYGQTDDFELSLDLARPTKGGGPYPALIFIHGGWWRAKSRKDYAQNIRKAAERGYVAITVDHRLTSATKGGKVRYPFPAQVHDVKCAARWLRANAKKYNIDPKRIGAVGWSSGGHLALMLGLTDSSDKLEGKCGKMRYSSNVQAVVNLAGITELESCYHGSRVGKLPIQKLLGGTPDEIPQSYKTASPISFVSKDDPPVLTIQGDEDPYVPPSQAVLLDNKMKDVGASHSLILMKDQGHVVVVDDTVWDFFDAHLKKN
jgi:acetyl esterase/lipase